MGSFVINRSVSAVSGRNTAHQSSPKYGFFSYVTHSSVRVSAAAHHSPITTSDLDIAFDRNESRLKRHASLYHNLDGIRRIIPQRRNSSGALFFIQNSWGAGEKEYHKNFPRVPCGLALVEAAGTLAAQVIVAATMDL